MQRRDQLWCGAQPSTVVADHGVPEPLPVLFQACHIEELALDVVQKQGLDLRIAATLFTPMP